MPLYCPLLTSYTGEAFHNVRGDKLYPSVGVKKNNEHLRVNFGSEAFVFDIDSMMEVSIPVVYLRPCVIAHHPPAAKEQGKRRHQ